MDWPGKVHDARVFSNSSLYLKGEEGGLLLDWKKYFGGKDVPLCILCDPAYPILLIFWLIKVYLERHLMPQKQKYLLSRARMMVENALGRSKGR